MHPLNTKNRHNNSMNTTRPYTNQMELEFYSLYYDPLEQQYIYIAQISNLLFPFTYPLTIILLSGPALNLYYYLGIIHTVYLRFGTIGTQIPYDLQDSTNGLYYYLFGTNSDTIVQSPYLLNGNYTSVLPHDSDFTLIWVLLLIGFAVPTMFTQRWPKLFISLLILFMEGSIFELSLSSTGQVYQTIINNTTDAFQVSFAALGGLIIVGIAIFTMRPIICIIRKEYDYAPWYLGIHQQLQIQLDKQNIIIHLIGSFLELINQFASGIIIPILGHDQYIYLLYAESAIFLIQFGLNCYIIMKSGNTLIKIIAILKAIANIIISASFGLLIYSSSLSESDQYSFGQIIWIILCVYLFSKIIEQSINMYMHMRIRIDRKQVYEQQTEQVNATQLQQPQQITLELGQQTIVDQNKNLLDESVISNIQHNHNESKFQSIPNTLTYLGNYENNYIIPRKRCLEISELFNQSIVKLFGDDFLCDIRFQQIIRNNTHEVDPKTLKRSTLGIKIQGNHQLIFHNQSEFKQLKILQVYLKVYYADKLVFKELKLSNHVLNPNQQYEIKQEYKFEQSDSNLDRIMFKICIEDKPNDRIIRFGICNNELKLFQASGLMQAQVDKLRHQSYANYTLLFEQRSEQFNLRSIMHYCNHYNLYIYEIPSPEQQFRNQHLSSRFGKISLILPGTPYIRLIIVIELQVNREYMGQVDGTLVSSIIDMSRPQYVMISILAKKSSTQLGYSHQKLSEYYGQQLLKYFSTEDPIQ